MEGLFGVSYGLAIVAGLLSFLSPCVLPLMPAYLTIISGASLPELQASGSTPLRRRVMTHAFAFVIGFSVLFIALGATATAAGQFLSGLRFEAFGLPIGILQLGGVVVIVMGLHIGGWLPISALYRVWNVDVVNKQVGMLGAFLVGAGFAFGWSPCIGPILGSILTLAASQETLATGIGLLAAYSLGLAVPFLASAWSVGLLLRATGRLRDFARPLEIFSGALLILVGVLMLSGHWSVLNQSAAELFSGVTDWVLDAEEALVQ